MDEGGRLLPANDTPPCRDEAAPRMGHPSGNFGRILQLSRQAGENGRAALDNPPFAVGLQRMGHPVPVYVIGAAALGSISKYFAVSVQVFAVDLVVPPTPPTP